MLDEDRARFCDQIQKNITRQCFRHCKSAGQPEDCLSTCYDKYTQTVNTVSQSLSEVAYDRNSLIAYKAYPQSQIQMQHFHNPFRKPGIDSYSYAHKRGFAI